MSDGWVEVGAKEAENAGQGSGPIYRFKNIGDQFIGKFLGTKEVPDGKFGPETHYLFLTKGETGPVQMAINANDDLRKRLGVVGQGSMVRITYTQDRAIGNGMNPMKVHKVEVGGGPTAPAAKPAF